MEYANVTQQTSPSPWVPCAKPLNLVKKLLFVATDTSDTSAHPCFPLASCSCSFSLERGQTSISSTKKSATIKTRALAAPFQVVVAVEEAPVQTTALATVPIVMVAPSQVATALIPVQTAASGAPSPAAASAAALAQTAAAAAGVQASAPLSQADGCCKGSGACSNICRHRLPWHGTLCARE